MTFKGIGPIKLGKVQEQFNFATLTVEYYVWFAGQPILIGKRWL